MAGTTYSASVSPTGSVSITQTTQTSATPQANLILLSSTATLPVKPASGDYTITSNTLKVEAIATTATLPVKTRKWRLYNHIKYATRGNNSTSTATLPVKPASGDYTITSNTLHVAAIAGTSTTTVTVTPQLNIEGGFLGILTSQIAQTNVTYNIVTKTTNTGFNNPNLNRVTITSSSDSEKVFLSQIAGQAFVIQQQTLYNLGAGNKILETATALVASQGTIGAYIYSPQATLVQHAEGIGILALEAAPSVFLVPIGEAEPLAAEALGTITSSSAASLPTQALGGLVITEVSGAATTEASSLVLTGRPASATSLGYSVAFSTAAVGATYLAAGAYSALSSVVKPYIGTQIITFSESTGENGVQQSLTQTSERANLQSSQQLKKLAHSNR